jgi:hypothetical protein
MNYTDSMEKTKYECPICKKIYQEDPITCPNCQFEGLTPLFSFMAKYIHDLYGEGKEINNTFLKIYKYSKKVALGQIPYKPSEIVVFQNCEEFENGIVDEIVEERGLAYVNNPDLMLRNAVIPLHEGVKSLVLNVKGAKSRFLEDAAAIMLFLGKDFEILTEGYIYQHQHLRYIWVHPDNSYFYAENNVLFNKDKTKLICYAYLRPEEEYTIPRSVKKVVSTFYHAQHLKKLYVYKDSPIAKTIASKINPNTCEIIYID